MIEIKRKQGETMSAFLRRFSKKVQQSRILLKVRKKRFNQPQKSKREIRLAALHRQFLQKERERLEKFKKPI